MLTSQVKNCNVSKVPPVVAWVLF